MHMRTHTGEVQDAYVVSRLKDLPKLHKAVWKGEVARVKHLTKDLKKGEVDATDKMKR